MRFIFLTIGLLSVAVVLFQFMQSEPPRRGGTSAPRNALVEQAKEILETSNDNAFKLCAAIDGMGDATAPCQVWGRTVTITVPMGAVEAKKFCLGAAGEMRRAGATFERGWVLQIKSPYSGGNNTAVCEL